MHILYLDIPNQSAAVIDQRSEFLEHEPTTQGIDAVKKVGPKSVPGWQPT